MNTIRKALTTLGGIFLAALLIAALAPKATRGIAAALVQVTNTSANPVPTVSADANFPDHALLCTNECGPLPESFSVPSTTTTGVPVKRLVIEDLNVICNAGSPGVVGSDVPPSPRITTRFHCRPSFSISSFSPPPILANLTGTQSFECTPTP